MILWGKKPPFKIIDGFRRIKAIRKIEWDKVRAIIKKDISEDDAYRLSFVENVKRKNFTPIDMANLRPVGRVIVGCTMGNRLNDEMVSAYCFTDEHFIRIMFNLDPNECYNV
ncbi:ParB N-terminal domain-containing protein [bacterium]|nr:ParB N-terminal domain-containing protein [bacterium]